MLEAPTRSELMEGEAATALAPGLVAPEPVGEPSRLASAVHAPWGPVVLLGVLTALGAVGMDMYLPALPQVTRDLGASPQAAQLTISLYLIGLAVGQLMWGSISDRVGRRGPMLAGVALFLLGSAACSVAGNVEQMIAARLVQAMGACAGSVVPRAVVRDRYDDHEVLHVFALLSLVFGAAPILAPLVGGWVLSVADWRWIFGVQALFGVAIAFASWRFLPESRSEATRLQAQGERPWASYWALLSSRDLFGLLVTASLSGAAFFAYLGSAPEIVITIFHVPAQHFGWVFGANAMAWIGAGQINARIARRWRSETILRAALWAALPLAGVLLVCASTGFGGLWGVLVPLFLTLGTMGFVQPNATALAMAVDRTRAGATAALLGSCFFGLGSVAGMAVAALHDGTPRPMALVLMAMLVLACIAMEVVVVRPRRLRAAAPLPNAGADPT